MLSSSHHESEFIASSRILMICVLVYHHLFEIPGSTHSPRLSMADTSPFLPEFINSFIHMAAMTAVPLLSVVSGYLFFHRDSIHIKDLLQRRVFSVAIPSWIWCFLWLSLAYLLYLTGWFSGGTQPFDYGFESPGIWTLANGVFGITRQPFAFQFWFVHDLLLTLLLSPLLYFFLLCLGWRLLVVMALLWLVILYPPVFFSGNVLMFFAVGAWLALPESPGLVPLLKNLERYRWPLVALFSLILTLRIMSHVFPVMQLSLQGYLYLCLLRVLRVLSASALIYHLVTHMPNLTRLLLRYSGYYQLPANARLKQVVSAVRGDEMRHRNVNHAIADGLM